MRVALAAIAALSLCVTPVLAQGKSKTPAAIAADALALEVIAVCEGFAKTGAAALEDAIAKGWDAYESTGESPYVLNFNASKEFPGIGVADIFVLVEDYPTSTLGYCRMDVAEPQGNYGNEAIQAIQALPQYEGQSQQVSDGSFASLTGTDAANTTLLLTHWSAESFVVQLTIITPKAASAN